MTTYRELLPFMILDKYCQLIDMDLFLYDNNNIKEALETMSPNRFLVEYKVQTRIAKGLLNYTSLDKMIVSKYELMLDVVDDLKTEFDTMYPIEKFPEYYL